MKTGRTSLSPAHAGGLHITRDLITDSDVAHPARNPGAVRSLSRLRIAHWHQAAECRNRRTKSSLKLEAPQAPLNLGLPDIAPA